MVVYQVLIKYAYWCYLILKFFNYFLYKKQQSWKPGISIAVCRNEENIAIIKISIKWNTQWIYVLH